MLFVFGEVCHPIKLLDIHARSTQKTKLSLTVISIANMQTKLQSIRTQSEIELGHDELSTPQPAAAKAETTPSATFSSQTQQSISTTRSHSEFNLTPESMPQVPKRVKYFKISLIIILLSIITVALIHHQQARDLLVDYLHWWQNNMLYGMLLYLFVYLALVITTVGGSWMTIGGGLVFSETFGPLIGIPLGAILGWLGQSIGAQITYANCQWCFRDAVLGWTSKRKSFELVDSLIGIYGFKIAFLLRLSPLTPFGVMNYIMGVTSIKFKDYSLSHIGMLPDSFLMSFIGASIDAFVEIATVGIENNLEIFIATIIGTIIAFVGIVYVGYKSKKEFIKMKREYKQTLKQQEKEKEKDKEKDKEKEKGKENTKDEPNLKNTGLNVSNYQSTLQQNKVDFATDAAGGGGRSLTITRYLEQEPKHHLQMSSTEMVYK